MKVLEVLFFPLMIPICAYFSGKGMSHYKDFIYLNIPKKISWIFFVRYDHGRIPLSIAICQITSLLYMFFAFIIFACSVIAGVDMIYYIYIGFGPYLLISLIDTLYSVICHLVLSKK